MILSSYFSEAKFLKLDVPLKMLANVIIQKLGNFTLQMMKTANLGKFVQLVLKISLVFLIMICCLNLLFLKSLKRYLNMNAKSAKFRKMKKELI